MITYYKNKKGKLTICEDTLTSTVFDLLKYLPHDILWSVIKKSLYIDNFPKYCGEIKSISFWEKWNPNNTTNIRFVEPDVFIRFEDFDLIVEAKRYDNNQQSSSQLKNQIISYYNEFKDEEKALYYLQVGGLYNKDVIENHDAKISKTDWSRILNEVIFELQNLHNINFSPISAYRRILEDLVHGFELHYYFKKRWLKTVKLDSKINIHTTEFYNLFRYAKRHK